MMCNAYELSFEFDFGFFLLVPDCVSKQEVRGSIPTAASFQKLIPLSRVGTFSAGFPR